MVLSRRLRFILAGVMVLLLGAAGIAALIMVRFPVRHLAAVRYYAAVNDLDPALVLAVIMAESSFREEVVSHAGAQGLMQIMPATAEEIARQKGIIIDEDDIFIPQMNIAFGTFYLGRLITLFDGETETALAAYNAGRGNVAAWLANSDHSSDGRTLHSVPFRETENYLRRVSLNYRVYRWLLRLRRA